jgi:hypothetical protein
LEKYLKCLIGNVSTKKYSFSKIELCANKFRGVQCKPGWRYVPKTTTAKEKIEEKNNNLQVLMVCKRRF